MWQSARHVDVSMDDTYQEWEERRLETPKRQNRRKREKSNSMPYFGVPVVGFFRPKDVNIHQSERTPFTNSWRNLRDYRTNSLRNCRKRSGKELWEILRYHVFHESFHIRYSLKDTSDSSDDIQFKNVNLPFEFSILDCFLALVIYLFVSVVAFSFVFEKWTVIDSMYFAVVTFTTIGYGDLSPTSTGGKMFCVVFALSGVAVLAIALGVVGSKVVEAEVQSINAVENEIVKDIAILFQKSKSRVDRQSTYFSSRQRSQMTSSFEYLSEYDDPTQSFRERLDHLIRPFHACRKVCISFLELLARYLPALTPLFVGAFIIGRYEDWNWEDTIYYCVVTTTTIGYGDLTPQRQSTKLFAVLFIPLAVGAMGHFLGTIANFIVDQRSREMYKRLWQHELTVEDLRTMSSNVDGTVTELDFMIFMLQAMKKVDSDLIIKIREHFKALDLTHSGTLARADLELMAKRKLRTTQSKLRLAAYKSFLKSQGSFLSSDSYSDSETSPTKDNTVVGTL
jgi:Ion channel